MTTQEIKEMAVRNARKCNQVAVEWMRSTNSLKEYHAFKCIGFRNQWMDIARHPEKW